MEPTIDNKRLYAVYKCRLCGKLRGDMAFNEATVLATQSTLMDGESFRRDVSIRDDVREAGTLRLVSSHECGDGTLGLADFVGWSRHPIGETFTPTPPAEQGAQEGHER